MANGFLPVWKKDMERLGWSQLDVILVTGDAYVDHPSYGAAVIARVLEDAGFRVGIIAQPDWRRTDNFTSLGRPRLFFGVTAGNLDSMVANYTANRHKRKNDDYSPGAKPGLRPDRASVVYTNRVKEAFPDVPVILGGLEASMRRLAHYDYWSDKVRRSILLDSKADILVYGMGEAQVIEIAKRLKEGKDIRTFNDIKGTVVARSDIDGIKDLPACGSMLAGRRGYAEMPSFEEVSNDKDKFNAAFKAIYSEFDPIRGKTVIQRHGERFVIQLPPALPLTKDALDRIYALAYERDWHPVYDKESGIPGFEAVRFSITSHRGCPGECSFCSLYLHQGKIVQSRSPDSVIKEVKILASRKDFKGTITDIGGPTANLYMAECGAWKTKGGCADKRCLVPDKCKNLKLGYEETLKLWKSVMKVPGVKHLFIGSGVRHDLLVDDYSDEYLMELCRDHISGRLKVAPEHSAESVLKLMNKPSFKIYERFVRRFDDFNRRLNKKQYLVNYFITSHPGSGLKEALHLANDLKKMRLHPEQIQDFIPLPMTLAGCVYYTGKDPFTGKGVYVARGLRERKMQRALLQYRQPKNRKYVTEALKKLNVKTTYFRS